MHQCQSPDFDQCCGPQLAAPARRRQDTKHQHLSPSAWGLRAPLPHFHRDQARLAASSGFMTTRKLERQIGQIALGEAGQGNPELHEFLVTLVTQLFEAEAQDVGHG